MSVSSIHASWRHRVGLAVAVVASLLLPGTASAATTLQVGPVAPRATASLVDRIESEHLLVQEWTIENAGPDAVAALQVVADTNRAGAWDRPSRWTWRGVDVSASCPYAVTTWPAYATTCSLGALAAGESGVLRFETRPYASGGLPFDTTLAVSGDGSPAVTSATSSVPVDPPVDDPPACTVPASVSAVFGPDPVAVPYSCVDPEGHPVTGDLTYGYNWVDDIYFDNASSGLVRWKAGLESEGATTLKFLGITYGYGHGDAVFRQDVVVTRTSTADVSATIEGPDHVTPVRDAEPSTPIVLRVHNGGSTYAPRMAMRIASSGPIEVRQPFSDTGSGSCGSNTYDKVAYCGVPALAPGRTFEARLALQPMVEDPPAEVAARVDVRLEGTGIVDAQVNTGVVAASHALFVTPMGPKVVTLPKVSGAARVGSMVTCVPGTFSPAATSAGIATWHMEGERRTAPGRSIQLGHGAAGEKVRCETSQMPTRWGPGRAFSPWILVFSALRFTGTRGNDEFGGDHRANVANMGAGHDGVDMDAGDDRVDLGPGNDGGYLGEGNDVAKLGPGNDAVAGEAGNDRIDCGTGADLVDGRAGHDVIRCNDRAGRDRVYCGYGDDVAWVDRGDRYYDCDTVYVCTRGRSCVRKVIANSRSGRSAAGIRSIPRAPRPGP